MRPHRQRPTRLPCPWDSPRKNTGVGCHFLLQGIFPIQGSNWCLQRLLHWQADSLPLSHLGSAMQDRCPINTSRLIQVSSFCQLTLKNAAAAKSLHSCPTLWGPIVGSPPGSPIPGILQARTLEFLGCHFLLHNSLEGHKSRFKMAQERISELEDRPVEAIQTEETSGTTSNVPIS